MEMDNPGYGYDQNATVNTQEHTDPYTNHEKQTPPSSNNVDPSYKQHQNTPYPTHPQDPGYPEQQNGTYSTTQSYAVPTIGNGYPHTAGTATYSAGSKTVVITQPGTPYGFDNQGQSWYTDNTGAIVFSCVVSWCCCCICGITAFIFALMAGSARTTRDRTRKVMISTRLSIAGMVIGIVIWLFFFIMIIVAAAR